MIGVIGNGKVSEDLGEDFDFVWVLDFHRVLMNKALVELQRWHPGQCVDIFFVPFYLNFIFYLLMNLLL